MHYLILYGLFSFASLFSAATSEKEQGAKLGHLRSMGRVAMRESNSFNLDLSPENLSRRGRSKSFIQRPTMSPIILPGEEGDGEFLSSSDEEILQKKKKRSRSGSLQRTLSLNSIKEMLEREESKNKYVATLTPTEKKLYDIFDFKTYRFIRLSNSLWMPLSDLADKNATPKEIKEKFKKESKESCKGQRTVYEVLGEIDYGFVLNIPGLFSLLLKKALEHDEKIHIAHYYTAYLRLRLRLARQEKSGALLRAAASSSSSLPNSPRSYTPDTIDELIQDKNCDENFEPVKIIIGDDGKEITASEEDQKKLFDVVGALDFNFIKTARGLLPVLLSIVSKKGQAFVFEQYAHYLREKLKEVENKNDGYRSPRIESPRSVLRYLEGSHSPECYSPRKSDTPVLDRKELEEQLHEERKRALDPKEMIAQSAKK